MNVRTPETLVTDFDGSELNRQRRELLEQARSLDYLGKRFERFLSIQLQQLEVAIDDFQRERAAWQRQRDRELQRIREQQPSSLVKDPALTVEAVSNSISIVDSLCLSDLENHQQVREISGSASAPLKVYLQPGSASALQIGLVLFEISKYNREIGGGGVRFEVNHPRVQKKSAFSSGHISNDEPGAVLCLEAFSCMPLLTYDGRATRHLNHWEHFKSQILMSSLIDDKLAKQFENGVEAPRDHIIRELALEATRRADVANSKMDTVDDRMARRFRPTHKDASPTHQQLQRVEQLIGFLKDDYEMRVHLSLV